jgi:EAL and modified HD-GYP domain-containing signal transduction protein
MQDHPVLGQVALGYSPMIDKQRAVSGWRLTVYPEGSGSTPDGASLLAALDTVWPPTPGDKGPARLLLNLAGEELLCSVMDARPGRHRMIEVPAFMAADARHQPALARLHADGTPLMLKGRPLSPLPAEVLALFTHCLLTPGENRGDIAPVTGSGRHLAAVQAGTRSTAAADAAFQRGMAAVVGWPWEDPPTASPGRGGLPPDAKTVLDLINGVEREDPVPQLEAVLRRDPTLAFRLMRYLNSPAFGLPVEVTSFGHALMLLGYRRLKRWLALLLVSAAKGPNSQVVIQAAIRRGLLMEALVLEQGDPEQRSEMFICGVFSLLPTLLQQPMDELLRNVPVPERVQQALRGEGGPFGPWLDLVLAIESESIFDIRERSAPLLLDTGSVSRAVLKALKGAGELSA